MTPASTENETAARKQARPHVMLMTYADERFEAEKNLFLKLHAGLADKVVAYSPDSIRDPEHTRFLNYLVDQVSPSFEDQTGAPYQFDTYYDWKVARCGHHIWKPMLFLQIMEELNEGDYLIYCDSKTRFRHRQLGTRIPGRLAAHLAAPAPEGTTAVPIMLQSSNWPMELVTLPIVFRLLDLETPRFRRASQYSTHGMVFQKTPLVIDVLRQWLQNMMTGNGRIHLDDSLPHPETGPPPALQYNGSRPDQAALTLALLQLNLAPLEFIYRSTLLHYSLVDDASALIPKPGEF